MLVKNASDWKNLGYYWAWANGSGRVFKRPYGEGSPTINELMITCGYAHDTEESVIKWLFESPFDRLEIAPNEFLYFEDFDKIKNYFNLSDVFNYLDSKENQVNVYYLPKGKYLLRPEITAQSLMRFGVERALFLKRLVSRFG